jgi:hypothetical protein
MPADEWGGLPLRVDPTMAEHELELRDNEGRVLAKAVNVEPGVAIPVHGDPREVIPWLEAEGDYDWSGYAFNPSGDARIELSLPPHERPWWHFHEEHIVAVIAAVTGLVSFVFERPWLTGLLLAVAALIFYSLYPASYCCRHRRDRDRLPGAAAGRRRAGRGARQAPVQLARGNAGRGIRRALLGAGGGHVPLRQRALFCLRCEVGAGRDAAPARRAARTKPWRSVPREPGAARQPAAEALAPRGARGGDRRAEALRDDEPRDGRDH